MFSFLDLTRGRLGTVPDRTYVLQPILHQRRLPKLCGCGATAAISRARPPPAAAAAGCSATASACSGSRPVSRCTGGSIWRTSPPAAGRGREPLDRAREHVEHVLAPLEATGDERERGRPHRQATALVDRRRHDHVDDPGLVLEQHEDDSLRGRGALASDDHAGDPDLGPVGDPVEPAAEGEPRLELRAQDLERVLAEGDAGRRVVGDDPLPGVERAQIGRCGEGERQRQLGVGVAAPALAAPGDPEPPELVAAGRRAGGDGRAPRRRRPRRAARGSRARSPSARRGRRGRRRGRRARARRPAPRPPRRRSP